MCVGVCVCVRLRSLPRLCVMGISPYFLCSFLFGIFSCARHFPFNQAQLLGFFWSNTYSVMLYLVDLLYFGLLADTLNTRPLWRHVCSENTFTITIFITFRTRYGHKITKHSLTRLVGEYVCVCVLAVTPVLDKPISRIKAAHHITMSRDWCDAQMSNACASSFYANCIVRELLLYEKSIQTQTEPMLIQFDEANPITAEVLAFVPPKLTVYFPYHSQFTLDRQVKKVSLHH